MININKWLSEIQERYLAEKTKLTIPADKVQDTFASLDTKLKVALKNLSKNTDHKIELTSYESILWRELTLNTKNYFQYCMSISNNKYFCHRILQEKHKEYSLDAKIFICEPNYLKNKITNKSLIKFCFKMLFFFTMTCFIYILFKIITSPSFDNILFVLPYLNFIWEQPNLVINPLIIDTYELLPAFILTMALIIISLKRVNKDESLVSVKSFHKSAFSLYKQNNNQFVQNFKSYTWEDESDGNTKSKHVYKNLIDFIHLCLMNSTKRYGLKSDYIDNMWHEIISDTMNYQLLCISLNKNKNTSILHHIPGTPESEDMDQENYIQFLKDYCRSYNSLPDRDIWPYSDEIASMLADEVIVSNRRNGGTTSSNDFNYAYIPMITFMSGYSVANHLNSSHGQTGGSSCGSVVSGTSCGSSCSGSSGCGSSCGGGCGGGCGSSC